MLKKSFAFLIIISILLSFNIDVFATAECKVIDVSTQNVFLVGVPNTLNITIGSLSYNGSISVEVFENSIDREKIFSGNTTISGYNFNTDTYGKAVVSVSLPAYPKGIMRFIIKIKTDSVSEVLNTVSFNVYEKARSALLICEDVTKYTILNQMLLKNGTVMTAVQTPTTAQISNADLLLIGSGSFPNLTDEVKSIITNAKKNIFIFKDKDLASDADSINDFLASSKSGLRFHTDTLTDNGFNEILSDLYSNSIKYEIISTVFDQDNQIKTKMYRAGDASPIYTVSTGNTNNVEMLVKNNTSSVSTTSGKGFADCGLLCVDTMANSAKLVVSGSNSISDDEILISSDNMYGMLFDSPVYTPFLTREYSDFNLINNVLSWLLSAGNYMNTDIRSIKTNNMDGSYVEVTGVVTVESEYVTNNAGRNNAFHDCIYIQDETGGIRLSGVSIPQIGDTVGYLGFIIKAQGCVGTYNGEKEIRILDESQHTQIISRKDNSIKPAAMSTGSVGGAALGNLLQVDGTVKEKNNNAIIINDGTGDLRIFLNDYIGSYSTGGVTGFNPDITVGKNITAIGIASKEDGYTVLRIRDMDEIKISTQDGAALSSENASLPKFSLPTGARPLTSYSAESFKQIQNEMDSAASTTFADISGHWAENIIKTLYSHGIVKGKSETSFAPDDIITNYEFMLLLTRTLEQAYIEPQNPHDPTSREDMAVMAAKLMGISESPDILVYLDKDDISPYALDSVAALTRDKIMQGDKNSFRPKSTSTRAEASTVIYNILKTGWQI